MAVITRKISEEEPYYKAIDVEGVERNGEFWPAVRTEVSDDLDKGWEQIAAKAPAGQLTTRHVEPHTFGISAFIDLGIFRPFIGKKHYARAVLPDGEVATFFLDNLRPPANVPTTWSRARMGTDEELHPNDYEGIFLVPRDEQETLINLFLTRVEGENNQLTGYFACTGDRPPTKEEEKWQFIDSVSLWAMLQVAHDYHKDWQSVGPSSSEKEAIKVIAQPPVALKNCGIQLNGFRPFIGKYRFGRVVLPSGASTVIQLFDLLPPEKELIRKERPDWLPEVAENPKKSNPSGSKTPNGRVPVAFRSNRTGILTVAAVGSLSATAAAETPPAAPISHSDVREITRVIGTVTKKPILMIVGVIEESPKPGAVEGDAYMLNTNTGERKPLYLRNDLVSVYMRYTDRSHVDVYTVRKVRRGWKIELKKDWFL